MSELEIAPYTMNDSSEAMALERSSAQGNQFRMTFDRPYFHRRAENYSEWRLVTARHEGQLVGICGGALKAVTYRGEATTALYIFDIRVMPNTRRSGIAQRLVAEIIAWAAPRAQIGYAYALGDNEAVARLAQRWIGAGSAPACSYLVYPTYRARVPLSDRVQLATAEAVHQAFVQHEGPFELYCHPREAFASNALVGSWLYQGGASHAGCSAWTNEAILAEVIQRLPRPLAIAGALLSHWPLKFIRTPHVPRSGDRLRSWYLFDFHASDDAAAVALMARVAWEAQARGIDYCYIIHGPEPAWMAALRRQVPRLFAPIVPYTIMARTIPGEPLAPSSSYIDIRDV